MKQLIEVYINGKIDFLLDTQGQFTDETLNQIDLMGMNLPKFKIDRSPENRDLYYTGFKVHREPLEVYVKTTVNDELTKTLCNLVGDMTVPSNYVYVCEFKGKYYYYGAIPLTLPYDHTGLLIKAAREKLETNNFDIDFNESQRIKYFSYPSYYYRKEKVSFKTAKDFMDALCIRGINDGSPLKPRFELEEEEDLQKRLETELLRIIILTLKDDYRFEAYIESLNFPEQLLKVDRKPVSTSPLSSLLKGLKK